MEGKNKLKVAILFGGKSAEHEVSLQSAKNVIDALDVAGHPNCTT
jgi:D-alanine-D-alanine ligase